MFYSDFISTPRKPCHYDDLQDGNLCSTLTSGCISCAGAAFWTCPKSWAIWMMPAFPLWSPDIWRDPKEVEQHEKAWNCTLVPLMAHFFWLWGMARFGPLHHGFYLSPRFNPTLVALLEAQSKVGHLEFFRSFSKFFVAQVPSVHQPVIAGPNQKSPVPAQQAAPVVEKIYLRDQAVQSDPPPLGFDDNIIKDGCRVGRNFMEDERLQILLQNSICNCFA